MKSLVAKVTSGVVLIAAGSAACVGRAQLEATRASAASPVASSHTTTVDPLAAYPAVQDHHRLSAVYAAEPLLKLVRV